MQCVFLDGPDDRDLGDCWILAVVWRQRTVAWIGNSDYLFMKGVQAEWVDGKPKIPLHAAL